MYNLVECGICGPRKDHGNTIIAISSVSDRSSQLPGFTLQLLVWSYLPGHRSAFASQLALNDIGTCLYEFRRKIKTLQEAHYKTSKQYRNTLVQMPGKRRYRIAGKVQKKVQDSACLLIEASKKEPPFSE